MNSIFITFIYSSFLKKNLFTFKQFLITVLKKNKIKYVLHPVKNVNKYVTLLKSPHINKRAKENFQSILYKFILKIVLNQKQIRLFVFNLPKLIHLKTVIKK